jgi:hypothetical protein
MAKSSAERMRVACFELASGLIPPVPARHTTVACHLLREGAGISASDRGNTDAAKRSMIAWRRCALSGYFGQYPFWVQD